MSGYVYFIREQEGAVKIGHSRDAGKRLRMLQTANSSQLDIIGVVAGDRSLEAELHQRFSASHIRGEWFHYTREVAKFISEEAESYNSRLHDPTRKKETDLEPEDIREQLKPFWAMLYPPKESDRE